MKIFSTLLFAVLIIYSIYPQDINYQFNDDSVVVKPDYRNHLNVPEYNPGLMPLDRQTTGTGVWTELNPKVPRVDYLGIHFVNKDTGWACGGSGAIIKTTNGGDNWTIAETPVTNLLLKIHSYDGHVVIATGYDGIILRSTDGGETFEQVISGVGSGIDLWGVKMINDTLGWVSGLNQTLLKTTNAGLSWQQIFPGLTQHYWSLDFLNENFGMVACGGGKILKTTDGGNNWAQYQAGDTRALYTMDIIDSLHIAAAGLRGLEIQYEGGKNVYSSDAGITWTMNADIPTYTDANWIEFVDRDTGYAMTVDHGIYKTTNHGQNWLSVGGGGDWHIEMIGYETGYAGGEGLNMYKRINGIENWDKIFLNKNWSDVFFINELKGFFASSDLGTKLYKTEDGGNTYQMVENSPSRIYDILFLDNSTGFLGSNTIYKTTDGGDNWYAVNAAFGNVGKIFFINSLIGWAISGRNIYKTTDGGENWFVQFTHINDSFTSIFFIDSLNGWATSRYVHQTTDGGLSWIQRTDIPAFFSGDVYFSNYFNGWILEGNKLYKTIDAGINWSLDPQIYTYGGNIETISNSHLIITGTNIYESIDTGQVWQNITSQIGSYFSALQAPTDYLAYGAGTGGYIVSYLDTSIIPVELIDFSVEQSNNSILLNWTTATETNNLGFEIFRSFDLKNWANIGFIHGFGTTSEKQNYSFIDDKINNEQLYYKLKQIDFNGSYKFSGVVSVKIKVDDFILMQNYPNPANPTTNISFALPKKSLVKINLYSITGELIKEIINEEKGKGFYSIEINLSSYATGIYLYRMTTHSGYTATKKILVLK